MKRSKIWTFRVTRTFERGSEGERKVWLIAQRKEQQREVGGVGLKGMEW